MTYRKRAKNSPQNITQKTNDYATQTQLKYGVNSEYEESQEVPLVELELIPLS
jgi:hypothetical protein